MAINLTLNGVTYPIPEVGDVDWGDGYTRWVRAANAQLATSTGGTSSTPWVSVKDYGAVGDGATDDTTAVKAAMAVVAASGALGGTLYFPKGSYRIASTLQFGVAATQANVKLVGEGASASILLKYGAFSTTPMVELRNCDYWSIEGLGFDGAHDSGTGDLVLVDGCRYGQVSSSRFTNSKRYGLNVTKVSGTNAPLFNLQISNSFTGNASAAVSADPSALTTLTDTGAISLRAFGVVGDGVADDTVAVQAAFTYAQGKNVKLEVPAGQYKLTSTVTHTATSSANGLNVLGNVGGTQSGTATCFKWAGSAAGPMFELRGVNGATFEHIEFNGSYGCKQGVHVQYDPGTGGGSSGVTFKRCTFYAFAGSKRAAIGAITRTSNVCTVTLTNQTLPNGQTYGNPFSVGEVVSLAPFTGSDANFPAGEKTITAVSGLTFSYAETGSNASSLVAHDFISLNSCGVALGDATPGNHQASEAAFHDCVFVADGDTYRCWAGIRTLTPGNTKNFTAINTHFASQEIGVDWANCSGYFTFVAPSFGAVKQACFRSGVGYLNVTGGGAETLGTNCAPALLINTTGFNAGSASFSNFYMDGAMPANDYFIQASCFVALNGCTFKNQNTVSSVPKIQISAESSSGNSGGVSSRGCYYYGATGHIPVYDGSGNDLFGQTGTGSAHYVESFGDVGGPATLSGPLLRLQSVTGVPMASVNCQLYGADTGTGIGTLTSGEPRRTAHKVTVDYRAWKSAATSQKICLGRLAARTQVCRVIADTTVAYAGRTGTITLSADRDTTVGAYLLAHDVKTAAVTKGLLDGDLGAYLERAAAVQGGDVMYWSTEGGFLYVTLTSSVGNLGNGTTTNLTAGSTTYYFVTETLP